MIVSFFQPQMVSFGDQILTDEMYREQLMISVLIIFPVSLVIGHLSLRLASRPILPMIRVDIWNTALRFLIADLLLEAVQLSFQCVPFERQDELNELLLQSLGYGCPLYARALSPRAAFSLFGMRMTALLLGIFLGEGWMPVALTGGIATGKSTVAEQLVDGYEEDKGQGDSKNDKGNKEEDTKDETKEERKDQAQAQFEDGTVYLVDTDMIGHEILLQSTSGNVYNKIVAAFGREVLDEEGLIDRKKLGAIIFADPALRKKLNRITHPRIIYKMIQRILWGLFFSGKDMVIADVPLLFEGGLAALFCVIVVITCTPEQELERFMARNPELSKEECETRIASQMPVEKKAKRANIVIDNSGDRASLVEQVEEARRQIMQRLYGFGLTLFQIVAIMGGAMPIALYFKIYQETRASGSDPVDLSSS